MTTLHPAAIFVLRLPRWHIRVWLAVVITVVLVNLPPPVAGLALWISALPYLMMTETLVRMVSEARKARRNLEVKYDGHVRLLAVREAQIIALKADLMRARSASTVRPETAEQAIFRKVGLHPGAPEFLVVAARKAFRLALHPDRHPEHRQEAHDRFITAEAAFDKIARLRA